MENTAIPPIEEVLEKLDALNAARRIFFATEIGEEEQKADLEFSQLYDWFTEHNISIVYIRLTKIYILDGRQDLSTQVNSKP